jgi:hypothetical protein
MGKEAWCRECGLLRSVLSFCLYRVEAADAVPTAPATIIPIRPAVHPQPELMEPSVWSRKVAIERPDGLRIIGLEVNGAAVVVGVRLSAWADRFISTSYSRFDAPILNVLPAHAGRHRTSTAKR